MTRFPIVAGLVLSLLHPGSVSCGWPGTPPEKGDDATVGVVERLGSRIPLDLTFRDESGAPVKLSELVTGPTIILPVYYRCSNVCFTLQQGLARALPGLGLRPDSDYRIISLSFDETEQPELAAKYKKVYLTAMHAQFPGSGWRFLTGDAQNIRLLTAAAGYSFQRRGGDFQHPVASIVISGDGTIVRYLYGLSLLPKDLTLALTEARSGIAGASIRRMMDFCFSYDPARRGYVFNLLRVSGTVVILTAAGFLAFLLLGRKKRRAGDTSGDVPLDSP